MSINTTAMGRSDGGRVCRSLLRSHPSQAATSHRAADSVPPVWIAATARARSSRASLPADAGWAMSCSSLCSKAISAFASGARPGNNAVSRSFVMVARSCRGLSGSRLALGRNFVAMATTPTSNRGVATPIAANDLRNCR